MRIGIRGGAELVLSTGNITNPVFQVAAVSRYRRTQPLTVEGAAFLLGRCDPECYIELQSYVKKKMKRPSSRCFRTKSDFISFQSSRYFT